jgi:hypothetical protein
MSAVVELDTPLSILLAQEGILFCGAKSAQSYISTPAAFGRRDARIGEILGGYRSTIAGQGEAAETGCARSIGAQSMSRCMCFKLILSGMHISLSGQNHIGSLGF